MGKKAKKRKSKYRKYLEKEFKALARHNKDNVDDSLYPLEEIETMLNIFEDLMKYY